jgi:hypothetical protein
MSVNYYLYPLPTVVMARTLIVGTFNIDYDKNT